MTGEMCIQVITFFLEPKITINLIRFVQFHHRDGSDLLVLVATEESVFKIQDRSATLLLLLVLVIVYEPTRLSRTRNTCF